MATKGEWLLDNVTGLLFLDAPKDYEVALAEYLILLDYVYLFCKNFCQFDTG